MELESTEGQVQQFDVQQLSNLPNYHVVDTLKPFKVFGSKILLDLKKEKLPSVLGVESFFTLALTDGIILRFDTFGLVPEYGENALMLNIKCTASMLKALHMYSVDWVLGSADKPMLKTALLSVLGKNLILQNTQMLHYDAKQDKDMLLFQAVLKYSRIETTA
jgi:hypothetical protein